MATDRGRGVFYGWIVLAASFLIVVSAQGLTYSFAVFMSSLEEDFGWSRGMTSVVPAVTGLVHGPSTLLSGWLTDRYGPKPIVITGAFFIGLGLLLASRITEPWQMFVFYSLMVGFGTSCSYVPLAATVSRWFMARRGLALGILTSGIGLGTVIMPPLARYLISAYDWRTSFLVMGCAVAAVLLAASFLLKKQPEDIGARAYGDAGDRQGGRSSEQLEGLTLRQTVRTGSFWILITSLTIFTVALMMVMYHLVVYAEDKGIPGQTAATFLSVVGISNILGRLSIGTVSDRVGKKPLFIFCLLLQAVMMFWLIRSGSVWMFYMFAAIWGFGYGGVGPMIPGMTGELFGVREMGSIFGLVTLTLCLGGAAGPVIAGFIEDATGSYFVAFVLGAVLLCLSALGISRLRVPARGHAS